MSAPKEPSNTTTQPETTTPPPETTAPPSTSRLDSFFEETDVFVSESNALDEVFVQLSDGRLASCHDAWDEPQTDWRDMTLAVAAVLATRPVALRRRRSPAAPGER